jgi:1,4-dihydroxy-2-naphthoate octaprenyltransferase
LVLIGVELFNEYFDAKEGGDRIFLEEKPDIPSYFLALGIFVFIFAFFIGLYLASKSGWPILLFSFFGFLGAYFYIAPPLRWAYRGLGEIVIALSYGPLMVLGSYYLQTKRIDALATLVSLILGLSMFSLALINEIPDYFQDKLIGKKNIVVRLGRKDSVRLFCISLICVFIILGLGIGLKKIPNLAGGIFLILPLVLKNIKVSQQFYDSPNFFLPVIRTTLFVYMILVAFLSLSYLVG